MKVQFLRALSSIGMFVFLGFVFLRIASFEHIPVEQETEKHVCSAFTQVAVVHQNSLVHSLNSSDCASSWRSTKIRPNKASDIWTSNHSVRLVCVNNVPDTFVQSESLRDKTHFDILRRKRSMCFKTRPAVVSTSFLQCLVNCCTLMHEANYFVSRFQRHGMMISALGDFICLSIRISYLEPNFPICGYGSFSTALTLMEHNELQIASFLGVGSVWTTNTDNEVIKIIKVDLKATPTVSCIRSFDNCIQSSNHVSLSLHNQGPPDIQETLQVAFFALPTMNRSIIKEHTSFSPNHSVDCGPENEQVLLSDVITVSVSKSHLTSLNESVHIVFSHQLTMEWKTSPHCVFWDTSEHRWSEEGCRVLFSNASHTHCQCDHLTSFAVLVNVKRGQEIASSTAQNVLSFIGCSLSAVCLIISIVTFTYFGNLQSDRNRIHIHLSTCLLLGNVLFLTSDLFQDFRSICALISVAKHYVYLCALSWMLQEGLSLYFLFAHPLKTTHATMTTLRWYFTYILGYGVPFLFILPPLWVYRRNYNAHGYCWLNDQNGTIWSFVGPVIVVVFFNSCVLVFTIYNMLAHSFSSMKSQSFLVRCRLWIKGTSMLVALLGIPWIIGLLDVNESTSVFSYLFIVCNSTQGISIFILHCLLNKKVYTEYHRYLLSINGLPKWLQPGPLSVAVGVVSTLSRRRSIWRKKSVKSPSKNQRHEIELLRPDAFEMILSGWEPTAATTSYEDDSSSESSDSDSYSDSAEDKQPPGFFNFAKVAHAMLMSSAAQNDKTAEAKPGSGHVAITVGSSEPVTEKNTKRGGILHFVFGADKRRQLPLDSMGSSGEQDALGLGSVFFGSANAKTADPARRQGAHNAQGAAGRASVIGEAKQQKWQGEVKEAPKGRGSLKEAPKVPGSPKEAPKVPGSLKEAPKEAG